MFISKQNFLYICKVFSIDGATDIICGGIIWRETIFFHFIHSIFSKPNKNIKNNIIAIIIHFWEILHFKTQNWHDFFFGNVFSKKDKVSTLENSRGKITRCKTTLTHVCNLSLHLVIFPRGNLSKCQKCPLSTVHLQRKDVCSKIVCVQKFYFDKYYFVLMFFSTKSEYLICFFFKGLSWVSLLQNRQSFPQISFKGNFVCIEANLTIDLNHLKVYLRAFSGIWVGRQFTFAWTFIHPHVLYEFIRKRRNN